MKLSIGPIQYFWERQQVLNFYEQAANSVAEIIYLGEVICSKRRLVTLDDWLAIGRKLRQSGKEVILSSLTLLEAASEIGALKKLCRNNCFMVEANDVAAIQLLSATGKDFVLGLAGLENQPGQLLGLTNPGCFSDSHRHKIYLSQKYQILDHKFHPYLIYHPSKMQIDTNLPFCFFAYP